MAVGYMFALHHKEDGVLLIMLKMFKNAFFFVSFATKSTFISLICMITEFCDIVKACQRKEHKAQKRLYEELSPMVMGICLRYVGSRDEAEDLLQDTFLAVFENIGRLESPEMLIAWIKKIAVNKSISYLNRRGELLVGDSNDIASAFPAESQPLDTDSYELEHVLYAISQIPHRYSMVFNAIEVDGCSFAEVAGSLGMKEASVRSFLFRARQMIKEKLEVN